MSKDQSTKIASDGLRYKTKEIGSPFGDSRGINTMSCFKCGIHKSRNTGSFKNFLGKKTFVCGDCKPTNKAV